MRLGKDKMTYRTFYVSHSRADGFTLSLVERSLFREYVSWAADSFCGLTGHHLEYKPVIGKLIQNAIFFPDATEKVLYTIPIDRETADALAFDPEDWSWVVEEDEDDPS